MPPPKRPFTTSSLTSTLKSTIASQPLLSNLTNIDKLSSQATSLAQKTPFFNNSQNHQQQQHSQQHQDAVQLTSNTNSSNSNNFAANNANGQNMMRTGNNNSNNMFNEHHSMLGANNQAQQQQRPPMASTPTVDMSHLTEEERLMIQSVIAKAEMADMGMPVDTSAPSSTNLPSNASQALVQAERAKQQQNRQQMNTGQNQPQQGGGGVVGGSGATSGFQNQKSQQMNQQDVMHQQNQQQQQQQNMQQQQQQYPQQLQQMIPSDNTQNMQTPFQNQNNTQLMNQANNQSQFNQPGQQQQLPMHQNMQTQPAQLSQANSVDIQQQSNLKQQSMLDSRNANLQLTEQQQAQLLVNQINSQFNLGQNQEQQPQQLPSHLSSQNSQNMNQILLNNLQQQQQQQQQMEQQAMRDQQASQAIRIQQIPAMTNFDQSMLAQTQGLVGMNTQVQNQTIPQQQIGNQSTQQLQQQQLQQQQIQQQQHAMINPVVNDQSKMLSTYQTDYNINNSNALLNNQTANNTLMQQQTPGKIMQQGGLSDFNGNNMFDQIQQLNQINLTNANTGIKRIDQLGSNENSMNPIFTQQERQISLSGNGIMQNTGISAATQQTSGQNFNAEILHLNNPAHPAYNDPRSEIRFRTQHMPLDAEYNDHAFSDQEYYENRPRHQNQNLRRHDSADPGNRRPTPSRHTKYPDINEQTVDRHNRSLQAYDLAQRGEQNFTRPKTKLRQLPQPNLHYDKSPQSSTEHLSTDRQNSKFKDGGKHTRAANKSKNNRETKLDNLQQHHHTESEEEDEDASSLYEKKNIEPVGSSSRKSPNLSGKESADKNDEALRILSELRLSEQANQVMEQQQLLIKQSQELIKLQLEQQALSQELKKSIKPGSSSTFTNAEQNNNNNSEENKNSIRDDGVKDSVKVESSYKADAQEDGNEKDQVSSRKLQEGIKSSRDDDASRSQRFEQTKKSTPFCHVHDSDIDDESPRANSKSTSTKFIDLSDENVEYVGDGKGRTYNEKEKINRKVGTNLSNSNSLTASPRYNRDLFQSPTDTTDSDVEPLSHASMRRQQRILRNKPKPLVRRREPAGLPPSPLPVAAAIQLHQMQQQHLRQTNQIGSAKGNLSRSNFMRSRSVTSSPNHQLDYMNGGYMTDNQRIRSTSPDTLSEFGGQRRRKRLPEPPTNAVPITPSMVRKMIQTQRAGNSHGKLLASVNAKTTLLTNTHTNRQLTFERQSNESNNLVRGNVYQNEPSQNSGILNQTSYLSENPTSSVPDSNRTGGISTTTAASRAPELNKFLSSTYGNSILRNNISDIKDTPELDKLISNLDNYYGLDNKQSTRTDPSVSGAYNLRSITKTPIVTTSSIISPTRSLAQNYPTYTSTRPTFTNPSTLSRCNSEGESCLTSRYGRRSNLHTANIDDYKSYGRNLGTSSYLDGRSSAYIPPSSLARQTLTSSAIPDTTQSMNNDMLFGTSSGLDRPHSYYRPMQNQYRSSPRFQNSTGSFDSENLDSLTPTAIHEHQRPYNSIITDSSNRYQTRPSYAATSSDTLRDRYRYSEMPQYGSSYLNKMSNNTAYPYSSAGVK